MKTNKIKSVPIRMCIACKQMIPKSEMLRIIKTKDDNIFIDFTGKANGRGAYVCNDPKCMNMCLKKKILNRVFKCNISNDIYNQLAEEYERTEVE